MWIGQVNIPNFYFKNYTWWCVLHWCTLKVYFLRMHWCASSMSFIDALPSELHWCTSLVLFIGILHLWSSMKYYVVSGNASSESVIRHFLGLHTNLVKVSEDDIIELQLVRPVHAPVKDEVMLNAATNIMLASYRNQLLHIFIRPGMVALAVNSCQQETLSLGNK